MHIVQGSADARFGQRKLGVVAAELLADGDRRGVLHVAAADLEHAAKRFAVHRVGGREMFDSRHRPVCPSPHGRESCRPWHWQ